MSYLQLADNGSNITDKYLLIPAQVSGQPTAKFVREDVFDELPEYRYQELIQTLEPYQLSEDFLSSKASRDARRAKRKASKEAKAARKGDKQTQKERRREAKTARREARTLKKQKQAEGAEGFERRDFSSLIDTVGGTIGNIFGGGDVTGGLDISPGGIDYDMNYDLEPKTWISGVPNWVVIAGGGALTLGAVYMLTKKKKK